MAERQFGPYRLVRQIAVGGMAEIHLAKTAGIAGFEKYVALKMIHPNFAEDDQFIQMLVDEAKIAVQLTHGNIAQTFDLGRVGETYYITMEYVDGADLYKILRRASEQDIEMPLDVCAFVGKEISSALDHAHRKRDHAGKPLGIVHRDVSPQNVLVSYSGEVKLVDFGIAKATMKVRQTAVGVIKGKYYYMSPEQAWGQPIDHRSDIFSAGIVLYEMITGQMLYLEEDLHKLLEMARSADIAPPSKLRRGVPPQLERIVMHALEKRPDNRYQSAGDFATDLERFLHAYSPVFTASKLSSLLRQVVGDPTQVPNDFVGDGVELRSGSSSTHPLDDAEVAHSEDRKDLRDENSMIFRMDELAGANGASPPAPAPPPRRPTPPPVPVSRPLPSSPGGSVPRSGAPSAPARSVAPRVTRHADPLPSVTTSPGAGAAPPRKPAVTAKLPSIVNARPGQTRPHAIKPRDAREETRQLAQAPADPLHDDSSGLLTTDGKRVPWEDTQRGASNDDDDHARLSTDADLRPSSIDLDDELDNIGERTLITAQPGMPGHGPGGFMLDLGGDDGIEATLVTAAPTPGSFAAASPGDDGPRQHDDEPETLPLGVPAHRDPVPEAAGQRAASEGRPSRRTSAAAPPAALAARIHAPAVSELRKPRTSRRTPSGGMPVPSPNVLQAIVSSQGSAPMPVPRPTPSSVRPPSTDVPPPPPLAPQAPPSIAPPHPVLQTPPHGQPYAPMVPGLAPNEAPPYAPNGQTAYIHDASGLPMGIPTPPGLASPPGAMPAGYSQQMPHGYPHAVSPSALYPFHPTPQPQNISLTGQIRLLEVDELPAQYRLNAARRRMFTYLVSGVLAVSFAAAMTFLIIRTTRESPPQVGSVHIQSVPSGAVVLFDGTQLTDHTPLMLDGAPVGGSHVIRFELPHHKPHEETVVIPKNGAQTQVIAYLKPITGKILIDSTPHGAEIYINGQMRGRTPTTLSDIAMESTRRLELRLRDYQPLAYELDWPDDGKIEINAKLVRAE